MDIGLHFRRVDLHTHTPASDCFIDKNVSAEEIVQTAVAAGIDAIAVTDHNTGLWVDKVKSAAEGTELTVFPGVEVSVSDGCHVIALLDTDKGSAEVSDLLVKLGIPREEWGKTSALCKKSAHEAIEIAVSGGGLAILCHIDECRGAFLELAGLPRQRLFNEAAYHAVETSTGDLPAGLTKAQGFRRFPACYQASDNPAPKDSKKHSHHGIGIRFSWFKLDSPATLEGLRECFCDPEVRIHKMDHLDDPVAPRLRSVKMSEGFLHNQELLLNPGLNCIIGGKGVGKSLIVEFIRFVLDQPSQDKSILDDYHSKLNKRLGPGGWIEALVETDVGTTYRITRALGGSHECVNVDTDQPYSGSVSDLFPVLAYSQTEVIKIAENPDAQLELIDSFIDLREHRRVVDQLGEQLADSDRALAAAIPANAEMIDLQKKLNTLNELIKEQEKAIEKAGQNPELLKQFKVMEAKKGAFESELEALADIKGQISDFAGELAEATWPEIPQSCVGDPDLAYTREVSLRVQKDLVPAFAAAIDAIDKASKLVAERRTPWLKLFERKEAEYKEELTKGDKRTELESQRKKLDVQAATLQKQIAACKSKADSLTGLLKKRSELLTKLAASYQACYEERLETFGSLTRRSDGKLRLELRQGANRQGFEGRLRELLRGSGTQGDAIQAITSEMMPSDFVKHVLDRDQEGLTDKAGVTSAAAQKIIDKLHSLESLEPLLALEHTCHPDDSPIIEFRKDAKEYAPLNELSVGQKCTALLIIALSQGTRPVIIDQPEDALDIRTVWEDISMKLRRSKDLRQFVLTSHNATVVVSSDADTYAVVTGSARKGKVTCLGGIENPNVKEAVIQHLEGGPEPYRLRTTKYNLPGRNR